MRSAVLAYLSDPSVAFTVFLTGLLAVYWELCHPGTVVAGATGGAVSLVALYALCQHPLHPAGVYFLLAALLCFSAEVRWPLHGAGLVLSILLAVYGIHRLLAGQVAWEVAALLLAPFLFITLRLLTAARQAHLNKMF